MIIKKVIEKNIAKTSNILKDLKSETIMKRFNATIDVGGKEVIISVRNDSSKLSGNKPTLELLEKEKSNSKK